MLAKLDSVQGVKKALGMRPKLKSSSPDFLEGAPALEVSNVPQSHVTTVVFGKNSSDRSRVKYTESLDRRTKEAQKGPPEHEALRCCAD
ncbi:hypothetical protein KM043_002489 [Ampulex compressa]|nr:hypothetical protein KM043_002489 [Ampulex compressa]